MKRYLLGYALAYLASLLTAVVFALIALGCWLFSDTPLWFDVLVVLAVPLAALAIGELAGRRSGRTALQKPVVALLITLICMVGLAVVSGVLAETAEWLQIFAWTGTLVGGMLEELAEDHVSSYWDGAFQLAGYLVLPLLYHLGWHWGNDAVKQ